MNMASDTPRTDAKEHESKHCKSSTHAHYGWKLSRQLERELAAVKAERADARKAQRFAGVILERYADNWGTDFDGLEIQEWMDECGLLDYYKNLTVENIEQLSGEGYDLSDYDPGDHFYAYNGAAEAARKAYAIDAARQTNVPVSLDEDWGHEDCEVCKAARQSNVPPDMENGA
jgi:hypothetical protein